MWTWLWTIKLCRTRAFKTRWRILSRNQMLQAQPEFLKTLQRPSNRYWAVVTSLSTQQLWPESLTTSRKCWTLFLKGLSNLLQRCRSQRFSNKMWALLNFKLNKLLFKERLFMGSRMHMYLKLKLLLWYLNLLGSNSRLLWKNRQKFKT